MKVLKKLLTDQDVVFVTNFNDAAQAVVRGKAHLGVGGTVQDVFKDYLSAGLPLDIRDLGNTPDRAWLGTDGSSLGVFNNRPHPNAARVFVNWIMTQRVEAALVKATHYNSRRKDVPPLDPDFAAIPGADYVQSSIEMNEPLLRKWIAIAKELRPQ